MSSYPDNIEVLGQPGPSHSTLRVQYHEEHGFMPGPELDRELVDNYWQGMPSNQEGNGQLSTNNIDPILLEQQQQYHGGMVEMSGDGHEKLIQRRPDLAPFMDSAPLEIYGGAFDVPQPDFGHGYVLDKSVFPVAHNQLSEPFDFAPGDPTYADAFVGGTAAVQECGIPYVGGAAPAVHNYGIAPVGLAAPVPDNDADTMIERPVPAQDDPFVTSITTSSAFSPSASTAASSAQIAPGPDPVSGPASAPQQAPQRAPRHTWSDAERARLMFLKEEAGLKWDAIHRILGAHTKLSIADKYYELCRKRRGLKK